MGSSLPEFFRWQGENKHFSFSGISLIFYIITFAIVFVCVLLLWIFKNLLRRWFSTKDTHLRVFKTKILFRFIGITTLIFMVFRSYILYVSNYPTRWEILPLHLCRLTMIFLSLTLILNRIDLVKYFGHLAIIGSILAIIKPDFDFAKTINDVSPIGLDSFYYYDYILAHSWLLLATSSLYAIKYIDLKIKDWVITVIFFSCVATLMFFINWITFKYAPKGWKTNYFYLGDDSINPQKNVFGVASNWPYNLLSWTFIGIIATSISTMFWIFQSKFTFDKFDNKFKFKLVKAQRWEEFYHSFNIKKH
ncbi:YwaF family protein [Mycoplasma zalophidermidis]|uniref:YwaF family protein n=2 Tax=Mycoplasma zalophidermidis TaxID=398174 RepID=A0ABS6DS61_9MOLU|nr:YwaF family protein [Mycoplasma zalophidermidis]